MGTGSPPNRLANHGPLAWSKIEENENPDVPLIEERTSWLNNSKEEPVIVRKSLRDSLEPEKQPQVATTTPQPEQDFDALEE